MHKITIDSSEAAFQSNVGPSYTTLMQRGFFFLQSASMSLATLEQTILNLADGVNQVTN